MVRHADWARSRKSGNRQVQSKRGTAMRTRLELTRHLLEQAYAMASDNLAGLTLEQALFVPQSGYRSILGILKHAAAWSHVYHSYAFAVEPKDWGAIAWPRGRIDTIEPSREYLH